MKYLITGSGGREHALAMSLSSNAQITHIYCMPGNSGTATTPNTENIPCMEIPDLLMWAQQHSISRVLVGSEDLLVKGIVDIFTAAGIEAFGPHKYAAQLEGSKAFAKQFMNTHKIRTATYQICHTLSQAQEYISHPSLSYPIVLKADGLASGKGVLICNTLQDAKQGLIQLMQEKKFGDAGNTVIVEQYLDGFETSIIALYDGVTIVPMLSARDHKTIFEHDTGPNTGGMGVVVPNPLFTKNHFEDFVQHILQPTQKGLIQEKLQFCGVLFFGLMIQHNKCYLLEYNTRFGDPEIQTLLHLLESDIHTHIHHALHGRLSADEFSWKPNTSACCVVMASGGYPEHFSIDHKISISQSISSQVVFAGTRYHDNTHYTNGGRVLNVINSGSSTEEARNKVYADIDNIHFKNCYYRKDIGTI